MADSTQNIDQIEPNQAAKEVTANDNFAAMSVAAFGGRRGSTSMGLTWGYYGGRWGGSAIAHGTLTLAASATNYIVADRATGEVQLADGSPDAWADTAAFARLYVVQTGASQVTAYEDHRAGPGGLVSLGAAPRAASIEIQLACSDLVTDITTGTSKGYVRSPCAMSLTEVRASLLNASSSGNLEVGINVGGAPILDDPLVIDSGDTTSVGSASPFAFVTDGEEVADDDIITVDIDAAGTGALGLIVTLIGARL